MKVSELKNKKIAIVGYGIEGAAVADFLSLQQIPFAVLDKKPKSDIPKDATYIQTGEDYLKNLAAYEVIIRAPGIQPFLPELVEFEKNGGIIETQMRLFFDNYPNRKKIIGVTGTKGKGTTSTLIKNIIEDAGMLVRLGGNIGVGVLSLLSAEIVAEDPWVVLELSSFQLQDLKQSPHIAVVLMVTSEHLDYHRSIEEYVNAKAPIVGNQNSDDLVIYNADYPSSVKIAESSKAKKIPFSTVSAAAIGDVGALALSEDNAIYIMEDSGSKELLGQISELQLRGYHNVQNVCAAALVGRALGISKEIIWRVSKAFTGLEHRLKFIIKNKGIQFYDDSFATIPESTITAINSFTEPIILFAGGNDKGADYQELGKQLADLANKKPLKCVVTLGIVANRIAAGLISAGYTGSIIKIDESGKEAYDKGFEKLKNIAVAGDVVLLAPGTASLDMFKNYKERGDYFSNLAKNF